MAACSESDEPTADHQGHARHMNSVGAWFQTSQSMRAVKTMTE